MNCNFKLLTFNFKLLRNITTYYDTLIYTLKWGLNFVWRQVNKPAPAVNFKKLAIIFLILLFALEFPVSVIAQSATPQPSENNLAPTPFPSAEPKTLEEAIRLTPKVGGGASSDTNINLTEAVTTQESAQLSSLPVVEKLLKKNFRANEALNITAYNARGVAFDIEVIDGRGKQVPVQIQENIVGEKKEFKIIPPSRIRPGKFTLKISDSSGQSSEQDFTWGVLAINTNKSIYLASEAARLAMAVLDEKGNMVCNADVALEISDPQGKTTLLSTENGKIIVNEECNLKAFTMIPDYEASYQTGVIGKYDMVLAAETNNGIYSISDSFEVREYIPFDVERVGPTRIYPPANYPVELRIKANEDFKGVITEVVPASFEIYEATGSPKFQVTGSTERILLGEEVLGASTDLVLPFEGDFPMISGFGEKHFDPWLQGKYEKYGVAGHDGADFPMPIGTPIIAVDDGVVVISRENWDYGTSVVIKHSWGQSYYGHLSEMKKVEGDEVKKGDLIALSGNTGLSTAPHLHFGIKPEENEFDNGYYGKVNPLPYLGLKEAKILGATTAKDSEVKIITWKVDIKAGESFTLAYNFKAPNISPEFYTVGPARFLEEGEKIVFAESRRWQIAVDSHGGTHMMLFWDPANDPVPGGWSVVSTYDGKFPRGEAIANVLGTGGNPNHTPSVSSVTLGAPAAVGPGTAGTAADAVNHTHGTLTATPTSANNLPQFRSLQLIRYNDGIPSTIPQNAIAIFDAAPTGSWSRITAQDSNMVRINSTVATGGSNTHTHTVSWGGLTTGASGKTADGASNNLASNGSTHTDPADTATPGSDTSLPPYIEVLVYRATASISPVPAGLISMFDGDPSTGWTKKSEQSGDPFYQQFIRGAASYNGTSQSSSTHSHASLTSGASGQSTNGQRAKGTSGGSGTAGANHTHTLTANFTAGTDHTPEYVNVVYAKKDAVAILDQIHYRWRNDDNSESLASWDKAQDTQTTIAVDTNKRIRFEISNEGTATSGSTTYQLMYGVLATTCAAIGTWTAVPTGSTEKLQIFASSNLTDGNATTTQLTPENTSFVAGQVKDEGNQTTGITLTTSEYTEIEYSIVVTSNALNGEKYCLRLTNAGSTTNFLYTKYAQMTVGVAGPTLDQLMRHGAWFDAGVEQPFTF